MNTTRKRAYALAVGEVVEVRDATYRVEGVRTRSDDRAAYSLTRLSGTPVDEEEPDGRVGVTFTRDAWVTVHDDPEHFPVCAHCGGPFPCRTLQRRRAADEAVEWNRVVEARLMARACIGCGEGFGPRQKAIVFPEPHVGFPFDGIPPRFHDRRRCRWDAVDYEQTRQRVLGGVAPVMSPDGSVL